MNNCCCQTLPCLLEKNIFKDKVFICMFFCLFFCLHVTGNFLIFRRIPIVRFGSVQFVSVFLCGNFDGV